jgi:hypothetical protein
MLEESHNVLVLVAKEHYLALFADGGYLLSECR